MAWDLIGLFPWLFDGNNKVIFFKGFLGFGGAIGGGDMKFKWISELIKISSMSSPDKP